MYYFHFFYPDFHVALPKKPNPGNTTALYQYKSGGAGAAGPKLPDRPNPLESGFHAYHIFVI